MSMRGSWRRLAFCLAGAGLAAIASVAAEEQAKDGAIAARYQANADRIIQSALAGDGAYQKLVELCDDCGHRLVGSAGMDQAIRWAADALRRDGQENVRVENVSSPRWVRGAESCMLVGPRRQALTMLGLGYSVGTPPEGITAPVVVVRDEAELDALGESARGKIVLFNNVMPPYSLEGGAGYGRAVRFRSNGARLAAAKGAVACLVRSVTATSLNTPHTGILHYRDAAVKIPAAALTIEDAELIARWQARGIPVVVNLKMEADFKGEATSANVLGELRGTTNPDEIVVIGGHLDTWDVGQGALDDGAGCVMALEALNLLRRLDLRPRRTIRVVLWTGEEVDMVGAEQYAKEHADELPKHVAAIEADLGCARPVVYGVDCADSGRLNTAVGRMREILGLCRAVGAIEVHPGDSGMDVGLLKPGGVIVMGQDMDPARYFDYHHSPADTLDKIDPQELARNVAVMATVAYVIADLPDRLGEGGAGTRPATLPEEKP